MYGINNAYHIVQVLSPINSTGAKAGDIVCMKVYGHADVIINVGVSGGTQTVEFDRVNSVSSSGATTLEFTDYYVSGGKIFVTNWNGVAWSDDELVTGAALSASLESFAGNYMTVFDMTTGVVAAETITGGTSGATAIAVNANEYEDVLVKRIAASNTFTMAAVSDVMYVVPIAATMLGDGYDCFQCDLGAQGSGVLAGITVILFKARFASGDTPISSIYD